LRCTPAIGEDRGVAGLPSVHGMCDARFEGVRTALADNLASRGEVGAALVAYVEGRPVVDLWAGHADQARSRPWREDTIVNVFSVGKAFAAICLLRLVDAGLVALDDGVSRHWPGFVAETTIAEVLSHRSGLAAIARPLPEDALYDWDVVAKALATQEPWWPPGTAHGYHVHTFGFLVGEIVRRVTGAPVESMLEREIAGPLGAEVSFGLAPAKRERRAEYDFGQVVAELPPVPEPPWDLKAAAYLNPPGATGLGHVNTGAWMDATIPSANAHATARGVARIYAALPELLSRETYALATAEHAVGTDLVLGRPTRFGLGFQLSQPERPIGGRRGFGHFGAGGSVGFADPDAGVVFAYVMNRGGPRWQSPRSRALIDALYAALQ
jgi:CubicO group peptidase (beta-lactamase class C family)